jgi:DNA-binding transcriptional LysR family regulator
VQDTRFYWTEPVVWLHSPSTRIEPGRPVPLVSYGEECLFTRNAMMALSQANRECELVFIGSSLLGLGAAVAAGLGVMALPRGRAGIPGVSIWEDAPLPKLPDIFCGIYLRAGADIEEREQVAEAIAAALNPFERRPSASTAA